MATVATMGASGNMKGQERVRVKVDVKLTVSVRGVVSLEREGTLCHFLDVSCTLSEP